jgi:hypothetical protein
MMIRVFVLVLAVALSGCQVTPNRSDPTAPGLEFRIYYAQPRFASRATAPVTATASVDARRCVYVASPFAVQATASDPGGIASIIIGPVAGGLAVRSGPGELLAAPTPDAATRTDTAGRTFANPGVVPGTENISVDFSEGRAYDGAFLFGTYEFAPGQNVAALRATVRNFTATTAVAEIYNFSVRRAGQSAAEQPGAECRRP